MTLRGGSKENISWTSARTNNIRISYSTNNGTNWIDIGTADASKDTVFVWDTPTTTLNNVLVKLQDLTTQTNFDQSVVPFAIIPKVATITAPAEGRTIGYKTPYLIQFTVQQVASVNIDLSTNNGANWTNVTTNQTTNNFTYKFPEFTGDAWLRITDPADGSFEIRKFKLIEEKITFTSPVAGAVICDTLKSYTFNWNNLAVDRFSIFWSIDDFKTSRRVGFNTFMDTAKSFRWNNPNWDINECLKLRAVNQQDQSIVYGEVSCIKIDDCITSVNGFANTEKFKMNDITPNPANNKVNLNFVNNLLSNKATVKVMSTDGSIILTKEITTNQGINSYELDVTNIAVGNYIIVVEAGEFKALDKLQIVR
jgi:hypothetical protein